MCNLDLCFVAEHSNTWCYNAGVCKHNKRGLSLDIYIYTGHGCNVSRNVFFLLYIITLYVNILYCPFVYPSVPYYIAQFKL